MCDDAANKVKSIKDLSTIRLLPVSIMWILQGFYDKCDRSGCCRCAMSGAAALFSRKSRPISCSVRWNDHVVWTDERFGFQTTKDGQKSEIKLRNDQKMIFRALHLLLEHHLRLLCRIESANFNRKNKLTIALWRWKWELVKLSSLQSTRKKNTNQRLLKILKFGFLCKIM